VAIEGALSTQAPTTPPVVARQTICFPLSQLTSNSLPSSREYIRLFVHSHVNSSHAGQCLSTSLRQTMSHDNAGACFRKIACEGRICMSTRQTACHCHELHLNRCGYLGADTSCCSSSTSTLFFFLFNHQPTSLLQKSCLPLPQ
jgi:hypothetical protein